jgi:hypothetical protein
VKLQILTLAALLTGCDQQGHQRISDLEARMSRLEQSVGALEQSVQTQQQSPPGNWTLWQVTEALNAGYPQAMSAYPSKHECLSAATDWNFPGGKVVGRDPTIFQLKGYRVRLECLPAGTTPYAH